MPYNFRSNSFMSGREKKCPVCKKRFWATPEWVYRKYEKYYCSYHCIRTVDHEDRDSLTFKIKAAIRDGLTDNEIKNRLGVTQRQIDMAFLRGGGK